MNTDSVAVAVTRARMTAGWFGPVDRPLYGVWHVPASGLARGAVVLAPAIGLELDLGHRALRVLADRLSAHGIAVLRFDYDGTGDSAGTDADSGRVQAWQWSVREAVDAARAAGAPFVGVVGLRLGATLAASSGCGADALVLWDPCATGKGFIRQESVMVSLNVSTSRPAPRTDGSIDGPGSVYTGETTESLAALLVRTEDLAAVPAVLALIRADRPDARTTAAIAPLDSASVESCTGQAELLEVSGFLSRVPLATVERIAGWLDGQAPSEEIPLSPALRERAVVGRRDDGTEVVESVVHLGERGLFGIRTESGAAGHTVIMANSATTYHVGSARSWVDLARRLGEQGVRSIRIDQRDIGDSSEVAEPPGPVYYSDASLQDLRDASEAARAREGGDLVLVGHCSGSWSIAVMAPEIKPAAVVLINPWLWDRDVDPAGPVAFPQREVFTARVARRLNDRKRLRAFGARVLTWLWALRPDFLWRTAATFHIGNSTGAVVSSLVGQGTQVTLVLGPREGQIFRRGLGYTQERSIVGSGRFNLVDRPALDHGMLHSREGEAVLDRVVADIVALASAAASARDDFPAQRVVSARDGVVASIDNAPSVDSTPSSAP